MSFRDRFQRALDVLMKADAPTPGNEAPPQKSFAEEIFTYAIAGNTGRPEDRLAERPVPTHVLRGMVERNAPTRSCIEIIGREVTRTTRQYDRCWDLYPVDSSKDVPVDDPSREEYAGLEALLMKPDRKNRRSLNHIIKAAVSDVLTYDHFFISIAYGKDGMPGALYVEDAGNIKPAYDKKGNIGNDDAWFCDACPPEKSYSKADAERLGHKCPDHQLDLKKTAFVQFIEQTGAITARWSEMEMIHGHIFETGARLEGLPILRSLMLPIGNMILMDEWFFDSYYDQRFPKGILAFKGTPNNSVKALATEVEKAVQVNPHAATWIGLPENKDVQYIKIFDSPAEMQSIDYYKLYTEVIYRTFGVQPAVGGIIESGKAGQQPDMQRAVNANFVAAIQSCIAEAFTNSPLFDAFAVTHWYFGFTPIEEEDELMEAQTSAAWAAAAAQWRNAGYDTELDEDNRVHPTEKLPDRPSYNPLGSGPFSATSQPPEGEPKGVGPSPGNEPANAFENPKLAGEPAPLPELALLMKAAPGPRKIDRADAIKGLRQDELDFYYALTSTYDSIIDAGIAEMKALDIPSREDLQRISDKVVAELREELVKSAKASVEKLYQDGFKADGAALGVEFGARDQAALDYMFNEWPGVKSVLPEFSNAQRALFSEAISKTFSEPGQADWRLAVEEMKKASDAEVWKLSRIARSEATYIANQGRVAAYKAADPTGKDLYDWSTASDACEVCNLIAAGGPYSLDRIMEATEGGRAHPNCRCTIVKRPIVGGL